MDRFVRVDGASEGDLGGSGGGVEVDMIVNKILRYCHISKKLYDYERERTRPVLNICLCVVCFQLNNTKEGRGVFPVLCGSISSGRGALVYGTRLRSSQSTSGTGYKDQVDSSRER